MVKRQHEELHKLVIIDSHAVIHRAYHALPNFSSSKGEPTGALYGLISTLLRLVQDLKPDYLVAARDLPGPTHRHEIFEAYKGTRVKADPELIAQLQQAPEVFDAFGIPMYSAPGYEADDVIGTIVKNISKTKLDIIIASGDMDTIQLAGEHVCVYTMRKGIDDIALYDDVTVRERFGFAPPLMTDYKGLRGDPSDNIPGVKGIGEKTATELIQKFGTIENIYNALDTGDVDLRARTVELLKVGKKDAFFSKQLATIATNAPVEFHIPDKQWNLPDHKDTILALCDTYEFRSLKQRVIAAAGATHPVSAASPATGGRALRESGPETSQFTQDTRKKQDVSLPPSRELRETSVALWLLHSDTNNPSLDDILSFAHTDDFEEARKKIFAQLDAIPGVRRVYERIEQPLIAVIERMNETGVALDTTYLKTLAQEYNKELAAIAARIHRHAGHEFNINSPKQLGAVIFDELHIGANNKVKKTAGGTRTTREDELVKLAEEHPIIVDVLAYRELQKLLSTYVEKLPTLIADDRRLHAEFLQAGAVTGRMASQNPGLQNIPIKTEYGRRIRAGFVGAPGTVLAAIDYSQIELRIAAGLSGDEKLSEIFREGKDVHSATAAGVFGVSLDQVDYEMRRRAKVINFGILYGMGVNALRANLGGTVSRDDAAQYLKNYFETFSGLARWIEKTKQFVAKNGYTETLFGRRRYFPAINSVLPGLRAQAERMAVNAPLQGTQADIIKIAMVEADRMIEKEGLRESVKLVLQVHDELVYEIVEKDSERMAVRLRSVMESVVPNSELNGVPIIAEASIGKNWGDMKKLLR